MKDSNKNNPFKTPEDYFENLAGRVLDKIDSKSSFIPKEDGFTVPEGYFDSLNDKINERLDKEIKVVQLRPYRKYYLAAASIAAIVLVVLGLNLDANEESIWDDLAIADIEAYIENDEIEISSYELAELLPIDEIEISDILDQKFEEDNLLEYLSENIDHIEDLNIEDYE